MVQERVISWMRYVLWRILSEVLWTKLCENAAVFRKFVVVHVDIQHILQSN